ncbi:MaoC/PaaZ C-terminal domain-containing protein [Micrococcus sp. NPDC078436]|uniref:MaoC/PaaZ C-terminal domain-containing protein n=1 Tax=Micrococcus sp. NPDC078436 TaxID=3154960 RepID=UPI00344DBF76
METRTLTQAPALGSLYARAAAQAAQDALTRRRRPTTLPERRIEVEGLTIDPAVVGRWREVVGPADPTHLPSVLVHTQVFGTAMALMAAPDFPLPLPGMVHLSNSVQHHRPVPAGEPLTVAAEALGLVPHHAGTAVDVAVRVERAAGAGAEAALLWEGSSRYLAKGVWLTGERPERPERDEFAPAAPTAQWTFGAGAGRAYAGVSGDWNPIHLSGPSATLFGMKGAIAHGMLLAARMLDGREPAEAGVGWDIEFEAPVVLPARVAVRYERDPAVTQVTGWDATRGRRHFRGGIRPLT